MAEMIDFLFSGVTSKILSFVKISYKLGYSTSKMLE